MGALLRDRAAWRWPLLLAACGAAFLVNPFGPAILGTARIGAHAEVMAQINEMHPWSSKTWAACSPRST